MDEFCGWMGWDADPATTRSTLESMVAAIVRQRPGSRVTTWIGDRAALATVSTARRRTSVEGRGARAVWSGTPSDSGREPDGDSTPGDGWLEAMVATGASSLDRLRGRYAVAAVDERGSGLVAIDRIGGAHPVSYRAQGTGFVFATATDAVLAHPAVRTEVDPQAIHDYLYFHVVPAPQTAWKGIERLEPGGYLAWTGEGVRKGVHWRPEFREERFGLGEAEEEFRSLLRRAVARACRESGSIGCFLSGGTDSSTVSGLVGEVTDEPARTYSIGFDSERFDESEFALAAVRRFDLRHREYRMTPDDLVDVVSEIAHAHGEPFGNASAAAALVCARTAREDGVETMLGGDGGDELFGGNSRYAKQKVFEVYHGVPAVLRRALFEPILFAVPAGDRLPLLRKARSYVRQANVPMPRRLESYNHIERFGAETMFERSFLDGVDRGSPARLADEVYGGAIADGLVNRMLAMDLRFTLADNDLPKVSRTCARAGVDVAYPLLDDEIVDFSLRLPTRWKVRGQELRWFFKHALRDFLPGEVLTKKKHGFGLPFGVWLRDDPRLQEMVADALASFGGRGILRPDFLERLRGLHASDHATYYGVFLWVVLQLELWLRLHES